MVVGWYDTGCCVDYGLDKNCTNGARNAYVVQGAVRGDINGVEPGNARPSTAATEGTGDSGASLDQSEDGWSPRTARMVKEVTLLAHGGAVSTTAINTQKTEKGTAKETRFLRLDAADSTNQEERNLNVGFLKKFLPGTSAFKEANALRASRKAAKKAQEAAKKQEAVEKWFAPFKNEDHLFKVAFPAWKKEEWATVDILNYFAKNGKTGDMTPDEVQEWMLTNEDFGWGQDEAKAVVKIAGRGVQDVDGNLYFAGSKTLDNSNVDLLNIFVARINADGTLGWTKEWGTGQADAATSIAIINETDAATSTTTEYLYVPGYTWGYLDEGGHALNGFGQYGGRDVVLAKISLQGDKIWMRQFGTTANDFAYGVGLDGSLNTLLLSGGCITNQVDETVEVDVAEILETRRNAGMISDYEPQIMDPKARTSTHNREYDFVVSLNFGGDILDYAMDGGQVKLEAVDDFLDESIKENGVVTFSKVTHSVFSDDYIYLTLPLPNVTVKVESDDVAKVLVSESALKVSEDGIQTAQYYLQLNSEPLADVKIVVLPWLDGNYTQCYRFGLCNLTLPVSDFVFTPRNWNIAQKVAVLATDDNLDEYDTHLTGISHVSYSDDPKYNEIPTIPKIDVTVLDNDVSGFTVNKASVFVTEGLLGAGDSYTVVLTSEPFAKVTVPIVNVGTVGNLAVPNPTKLVFTWRDWNIPQTVNVTAFDDRTQDVVGSSSTLNHSITTNDVIYAGLKKLASVKVFITDNDKSGIELSKRELRAVESNSTVLWYSVRLTSEPWASVVVQPNASHDCYLRVQSSERVCNASLLITALYFGANNWSTWQNVSLIAVDDWLDEANVHTARVSHSSLSSDHLYSVIYATSDDVKLFITDNDVSFVNITVQSTTNQLHVAEGSFNDSYSVFLNSEPYEYVTVTLRPAIEKFASLADSKSVFTQPQVGISFGSSSSSDVSSMFTLPLTSTNNAIRGFKLTAGLTYNFRLVATDSVGSVGFGSVSVIVNSPPASGTFVVSPQSGYAMQDTFTFTCSLWSDDADDYPLTYSFGVLSTADFEVIQKNSTDSNTLVAQLRKSMTPLVVNQLTPLATAQMFPPADMADSESVTVLAFISDRLGAVALAYDTIEVLLPEAAKSSPIVFVSEMFDANGTLKSSIGGSEDRVNAAILATVSSAVSSVEASSSGLSQQARVLGGIAGSALTLDVPDEFLDSASDTLLELISILLKLQSSSVNSRRLVETNSDNSSCSDAANAGEKKSNWDNMVRTLQSLAALSSNELLVAEPPAVLETIDVSTYSAKGTSFSGQVSMALTSTAVACLDSDLYLNALSLVKSPHSVCTLNDSEPISRLTLFSVHSQAAVDKAATVATYASDTGVTMQTLPSASACVKAASESTRRLESDDTKTEQWMPLVALTIPHDRELSSTEQRNFSRSCRTWDAEASTWSVDVCFKDDSASTSEFTVCYCTQIESSLQVLVTLEERLDFYALHPDLYRNDDPSLVVSVTLVVLVGVFGMVAKVGQRLDARDVQREKQTTIKRLNRAKWSELEARMQVNNVFEDFDAYYVAQKQKRLETRPSEASTAVTDVGESSVLFASSVRGVHANGIAMERSNEPLDTNVQLPDEARTLFGSSNLVDRQYRRVTFLFRVSNLLLVLVGIVLLIAGIEVQFVLGRTPAELVLYLYGGPLGITLMVGGAVLIASGITGVLLARREASNAARTAYLTSLGFGLLAQFLVVLFAFHLIESFDDMPHGVALALRSKWDALSSDAKTQLQVSYACCGFLSISEEESCPEEALDADPPRTCSVILGAQASSLFSSSFKYVEIVLFVEVACVGHKLSSQYTPKIDDTVEAEAIDTRMKDLWSSAPSTVKLFVQNTLQCCGYERVEAANGSVSYTLQVEQFGWRRLSSTSTYQVYSSRNELNSRKTRVLTDTKAESTLLNSTRCLTDPSDGCATPMKQYVSRVARNAWQLCTGLAGFSVAALLCASGLHKTDQRERKWHPDWRLRVKQSALLVLVLAGTLSALACFILGLDVAIGWTLFSSSAFQMVFARSMGAALMVYGVLALLTHVYSTRAAIHFSVHQLVLQCVARFVLASAVFAAVGLTAHLSHYSSLSEESWHAQLEDFLDDQWSLLTPSTQNTIALEFSCCGFNDPVLVAGQGVVFDKPALGYSSCSLSISRGCKGSLMAGVESSFAWLFAFLLALALMEIVCMVLGALVLRDVRNYEAEAWFALGSRLRYVAGSFRRDFRRQHVLVSVGATFDPRLTRTQRAVSVLCAWAASLAVYAGYFASKGCYRTSLKACEQPGVGEFLGLGLVYGGAVGLAVQTCAVALFEHVRHRTDDETKEVATARQRKEKVLLFRRPWFRRRRPEDQESSKALEQSALTSDASTLEGTQTTTEERWFVWLTRFVALVFQTCGVVLFLGGCALATLLGLLRLGYNNSLYGVPLAEDVFELLAVAGALIIVALIAALANDLRDQHLKRSNRRKVTPVIVTLVIVAIVAVLALGAVLLVVFMIHEVVQDDASALNSWSVRTTGFSVVERLETAWKEELTGYAKDAIQQELRCCGFWGATDAPFLPCPEGDPVEVTYEALSVSGTVVTETKQEFTALPGCRAGMLARFHTGADVATYCALTAAGLLILMVVTSLFLARELAISKDAKLKLRVPDSGATDDEVKRDARETFETVVGLKIAAPARGKLRSQMLASSLDSVSPSVASELAAVPRKHDQIMISSTQADQEHHKDNIVAKIEPSADVGEDSFNVPYPAWIVYVVFAVCLVWLAIMAYLVAISAMELGLATSWRCVLAWAIGVAIQELLVEPIVILASIIARTLRDWWSHTLIARIFRRGRALLRIGPQDTKALEREQLGKSLTLYDRLRYAAAVRIQRRLLTRVTRARYLRRLRAHKQEQHRLLAVQRRDTLRKTINNFSEEEIEAFRLLFASADAAQLGLVSHTAIAQAVYELGVHVPAPKVRELLDAFDPAYADLVDFEHFLYGMHCVRLYHQQLQTQATEASEHPTGKANDEKLVSSSDRFGPRADPRAELLVKRQNLLRELRDRRESLAHKLMRKVSGKLPALAQRGKSIKTASIDEGNEELPSDEEAVASESSAPPTGTYVFCQNRKLSPKKRALESVLKKKHQERLHQREAGGADVHTTARAAVALDESPRPKTSGSPTKRALKSFANKKTATSRESTAETKSETAMALPLPDTETPAPNAVSAASGEDEAKPITTVDEQRDREKVAPVDLEPSNSGDESRAATAASDSAGTKSSESAVKVEEAKPFGAYMLLTKQPPPLRSQKQPKGDTDELGADTDAVPRPVTAEKPKTGAQSALEKALLKKQKAKSKPKL
ncbi:hypothetical protein JG688_00004405 [Phytophthora aleatoria]|uniref:PKD/REJ-like domain-containing protein n=1 Tax=Phytophthora aleatoria TaxID=2496075 RepID=A0A8J5J3E3_9STRA|nr:hypothetical protein JG688_00004405 [Phytophthora aleatoria]